MTAQAQATVLMAAAAAQQQHQMLAAQQSAMAQQAIQQQQQQQAQQPQNQRPNQDYPGAASPSASNPSIVPYNNNFNFETSVSIEHLHSYLFIQFFPYIFIYSNRPNRILGSARDSAYTGK